MNNSVAKLTGAEKKKAQSAESKLTAALKAAAKQAETLETKRETNKNTTQEGGERYSIKKTTGNKPFVEVEQDILEGVPESEWISVVKENLRKKFPNGIIVGNSEIKIDGKSRQEMTFSRYMQWLYNNDGQLWTDKFRVTNNADEILHATTDWVNEGLNHPRKDRITDFARGNILLRVGGTDYFADVVVGMRKNGSMVMYDVLNLKRTSFKEKEMNAAKSTNPSPGAARNTAFISDNIVSDSSEDVNKYSLKAGTESKSAAELRRRNRDLEEQLTYWRGQVQRTKVPTTNRADVAKTARELLRDTGARMDAGELTEQLQTFYDSIARNGDGEGLRYTDVRAQAREIADVAPIVWGKIGTEIQSELGIFLQNVV